MEHVLKNFKDQNITFTINILFSMIIDFPSINYPPRAQVGDKVYYRSPVNRNAVKRSVVVEIRQGNQYYEQVMSNGDIIKKPSNLCYDNTTFETLENALSHIMATLTESINRRQSSIDTLVHEQQLQQRILNLMHKRYPNIKPQRHDSKLPLSPEELMGLFCMDE